MSKFETNNTYTGRSIGDSNCVFTMTVIKRTAKTIVANVEGEGEKRLKIKEYEGVEFVNPFGTYSMAPRIKAA